MFRAARWLDEFGARCVKDNGHECPAFVAAEPRTRSAGVGVRYSYGSGTATEVSNAPAETPLPAALPLFVTGLVGLGLFARRRRKQAA